MVQQLSKESSEKAHDSQVTVILSLTAKHGDGGRRPRMHIYGAAIRVSTICARWRPRSSGSGAAAVCDSALRLSPPPHALFKYVGVPAARPGSCHVH